MDQIVDHLDAMHVTVGTSRRAMLKDIRELDARGIWRTSGCRDMAEWVAGHFRLSRWTASQWVRTAHRLEELPRTAAALESGRICLDKTVELTRFVTLKDESTHIKWAARVTPRAVRRRAERAEAESRGKVEVAHRERLLQYWWTVDDKLWIEALLPAAEGVTFVKALERLANQTAGHPDDEADDGREVTIDERRADALVAMASHRIASDLDPDRATVVVHAQLADLLAGINGAEVENGPILHSEVVERLVCDGRLQTVVYDGELKPIGVGLTTNQIPRWLRRLLWKRDGGCVFPGCAQRRFVHGHHIVPWPKGPTDLDNLVLLCKVHHDLVHIYGWRVFLGDRGSAGWLRPDGSPYNPGPKITIVDAEAASEAAPLSQNQDRLILEDRAPPTAAGC
ncbi:MAG: DUF222 domain-containing protein [Actinobacteria bacterium]|nr:DUF222 domain-containing protein [Actinomycetota bacterium]